MKFHWILAGTLMLALGLELACTATKPTTDDLVDPIVEAALCSFSGLRQAAEKYTMMVPGYWQL